MSSILSRLDRLELQLATRGEALVLIVREEIVGPGEAIPLGPLTRLNDTPCRVTTRIISVEEAEAEGRL